MAWDGGGIDGVGVREKNFSTLRPLPELLGDSR